MFKVAKVLLASTAGLAIAACSSGGGSSSSSTTPVNTDRTPPNVSFSPNTLSVSGRSTGASALSATDNVGVSSTSVSCTNGGLYSGGTFTAPDVDVDTTVVCTATARDAAGNTGTATLTVNVTPGADITNPTVSVTVPSTSVGSGETADLTVTANDNRGAPAVTVTCDNGGTWVDGVFTAPTVTTDTTVTCTVTAQDDGGNTATETVVFTIIAPDSTAPVVSFPGGSTLTVGSGQTANYTINITDNSGETIVPTVTCDNGGTWADGVFTAPDVTSDTTITCTVTAEDSGGNTVTESFTVTVTAPPSKVTISGTATFDFVPHNPNTHGLDYGNTERKPIRGATIRLLDDADNVLVTSVTDAVGNYSFETDPNTSVRIQILAEIVSTATAKWDIKIVDSGNRQYALSGEAVNSGTADSSIGLHAPSGWGGTSYTSSRSAAPFAILDPLYTTVTKFAAVDPDVDFPRLLVDWAPTNIEGSFYQGGTGRITLLGNEDVDTDEYDPHVVVHEWGHYFEDTLSRADSIGGPHSLGDRLDPRLAFGEGFGYALAAIILDDPNARDSGGAQQAGGFNIPVDRNNNTNAGWYSEGSIQSILYDLYDAAPDGADNVEAGLAPIYETLISQDYVSSPYFTTIFLFADEYRKQQSATAPGLDALISAQDISGTGPNGAGETNDGTITTRLPVYKELPMGGSVQVCSNINVGDENKLGVYDYLEFTPPTNGSYTLTMSRVSGASNRNPDFFIYRNGTAIFAARNTTAESDSWTGTLAGGTKYIIDAYDDRNRQGVSTGNACYDFSAQ